MTATLDTLVEIDDLRQAWPNEARDFTPWLAKEENIAKLADAIGVDITVSETESSVGNFNLDISAKVTGTDQRIIIENQLEETNHDHLGKLITYAAGKTANIVIWVVKHAREEHRAAIEWLNNHTDEDVGFFLCEVKLYKIGNSKPAPKFEIIEKPNDWSRDIRQTERATGTEKLRLEYWTAFQNYTTTQPQFLSEFRNRRPSKDHWLSFGIGSSHCQIDVTQVRKNNTLGVELHIHDDKEFFRELFSHKNEIEAIMQVPLAWMELPDKKAGRILASKRVKFSDNSTWSTQFQWIVETMIKMKHAFAPYL